MWSLVLLAVLLPVLFVVWLVTGVAGFSTVDDVCLGVVPPGYSLVSQEGSVWPPALSCRFEAASGAALVVDRSSEAELRTAGLVLSAAALLGFWVLLALRLLAPRTVSARGLHP